jgi:membrane protein
MIDTTRLRTGIKKATWEAELSSMPWWKALFIRALQMSYVVVRDLSEGQLSLRAMSLVYTTLLSLVPLLAVSFSVLKGFGVHNEIEPLLLNLLKPLGNQGVEITSRIIGFVDNVKASVLGSVGLALLLYTVVSLSQKVEGAFNFTWRVKRSRPFAQRFSAYLSVILIGPVLVFSALGITASLASTSLVQKVVGIQAFGGFLKLTSQLLPYFLIILAFTFFYVFVPNTKVRIKSALLGATVAGILWGATDWGFASFIAKSTRYTAIYSGFAILVMFMIWLYLSWLILLIGANLAYYYQHPEFLRADRRRLQLSHRLREKLALMAMFLIGQNHYRNEPAWTMEGLAQSLCVPTEALEPIIEALEQYGLLATTGEEPPTYLPARPLDHTEIKEVLDAVRTANEVSYPNLLAVPSEPAIEELLDHLDQTISKELRDRTVKELVLAEPSAITLVPEPSEQHKTSSGDSE